MNATPAPSRSAPSTDRFEIACEVLRLSVKPLGPMLIAQYALNCGVAALFAWQFSLTRACAWLGLITIVTVMRGFFGQRLPDALTPATLRAAQREHTVRTGIWEFAHGAAGLLLFNPAQPEQQLLLGLILMGMTLSSAFSISFYVPATQLAITLLLAPLIVIGLWLGSPVMQSVSVIGIGLLAMVWKLVASHARQLEENIGLRLNESVLREQALAGLSALEHAQMERLRFFSAANHDLRQPVMAIGLQAEVLRQQLQSGAEPSRLASTVAALSQAQAALEGLTNQLLEIGRIEAAADALQPRPVALAPLLRELAQQSARVRVRCPSDALVWTDELALRRVLGNLLDNAVKFAPQSRILLAVRRRNGGAVWRIEVRDAGVGIAAGAQERVFGDFEQIGNVERNLQRGHGLGLAIVRRLAERLGVQITLRSAPGLGAVFGFALEAAPADLLRPDMAPGARVQPVDAARPLRPGLAVLVVEDNTVVADSIAALLNHWQAEPRVYASAAEALALADLHAIDVALCDIRLPGELDGTALALRLQLQRPALTIALVSADITPQTQRLAQQHGWHILRKPVQPEALRAVLLSAERG